MTNLLCNSLDEHSADPALDVSLASTAWNNRPLCRSTSTTKDLSSRRILRVTRSLIPGVFHVILSIGMSCSNRFGFVTT
jgi:hypothetical protein